MLSNGDGQGFSEEVRTRGFPSPSLDGFGFIRNWRVSPVRLFINRIVLRRDASSLSNYRAGLLRAAGIHDPDHTKADLVPAVGPLQSLTCRKAKHMRITSPRAASNRSL